MCPEGGNGRSRSSTEKVAGLVGQRPQHEARFAGLDSSALRIGWDRPPGTRWIRPSAPPRTRGRFRSSIFLRATHERAGWCPAPPARWWWRALEVAAPDPAGSTGCSPEMPETATTSKAHERWPGSRRAAMTSAPKTPPAHSDPDVADGHVVRRRRCGAHPSCGMDLGRSPRTPLNSTDQARRRTRLICRDDDRDPSGNPSQSHSESAPAASKRFDRHLQIRLLGPQPMIL